MDPLFIRGADRVTRLADLAASPMVFAAAEHLWRSWQIKFSEFVIANGGRARPMLPPVSQRLNWDAVKKAFFKPTVPNVSPV